MPADGGLTPDPVEARGLQPVATGHIPQRFALIEGRISHGYAIPEAIVRTALIPELVAHEPVIIRVQPRGHRIVIGESKGRIGRTEATRQPFGIHTIKVRCMRPPLIVGTEAIK